MDSGHEPKSLRPMQLSFNVDVNLQAQGLQFTDLGLPQWNHAQYFQVMQNHSKYFGSLFSA